MDSVWKLAKICTAHVVPMKLHIHTAIYSRMKGNTNIRSDWTRVLWREDGVPEIGLGEEGEDAADDADDVGGAAVVEDPWELERRVGDQLEQRVSSNEC